MADEDRRSGIDTLTFDASISTPPVVFYATKESLGGPYLPPNLPLDRAFIPYLSTNPDPSQWPSGALWPPNPPEPVGIYSFAAPYAAGTFPLPAEAWARVRPLANVFCFLLSGPRITLLGNPSYQLLRSKWSFGEVAPIRIVHSAPVASAGASRAWPVQVSAGKTTLTTDLVLDGSGSFDRDGDSLTYSWAVLSGPAQLQWRLDQLGLRLATILPAGTEIPPTGLGTYSFGLTVRDAYEASTATVQHTLVRPNRAPTAIATSPQRRHYLGAGYRLREDAVLDASGSSDPDGDPLTYRWELVDDGTGPRCSIYVPDPTNSIVRLFSAGQRFDISEPYCMGTYGFRVTVADSRGALNSADITHTFEINAPAVQFTTSAPRVVAIEKLKNTVRFPIEVQPASGPYAVDADSYRFEIRDEAGQRLLGRQVTESEVTDGIAWDGTTTPGTPVRVGAYRLVVIALTEGAELTRTASLAVTVVAVQVTVEGTTKSIFAVPTPLAGAGGPELPGGPVGPTFGGLSRSAFAVSPDEPPRMPRLTLSATVVGLPATAANPTWEMRIVLDDTRQGRSWTIRIPETGWESLPAGQSKWTPTLPFGGGTVTATARCTIDGVSVEASAADVPDILGENPTKSRIRGSLPWSLAMRVLAYDASRFQQFGGGTSLFAGPGLSRPYLKDGRVGVCGVADGTAEDAWNWVTNIESARRRLNGVLTEVAAYEGDPVGRGGLGPRPALRPPPFTLDQENREIWTRLAPGSNRQRDTAYHQFDPDRSRWVRRRPDDDEHEDARVYADRLSRIATTLLADTEPPEWNDPLPAQTPTPISKPERVIRQALSTGASTATVQTCIAILESLGWYDLWDTLDALAGPDQGQVVTELDLLGEWIAAATNPDKRIQATIDTVLLLRRGRRIAENELVRVARIADFIITEGGLYSRLLLDHLGFTYRPTLGILAAAASAAATPVPASWGPFGDWTYTGERGGEAGYIGTTVHQNIAQFYKARHSTPFETVWTNTDPIAKIRLDLSRQGLKGVRIPTEFDDGKPDILEYGPYVHSDSVFGYEIKPLGKDGMGWKQAAREWRWYSEGLIEGGIPVVPGRVGMLGTAGVVQAPNGWAQFSSTRPGTITYKITKAPKVEIKARDEAKNRKDSTRAPLQGVFEEVLKSPSPVPSQDAELLAFLSGLMLAEMLTSAGFAGALIVLL